MLGDSADEHRLIAIHPIVDRLDDHRERITDERAIPITAESVKRFPTADHD